MCCEPFKSWFGGSQAYNDYLNFEGKFNPRIPKHVNSRSKAEDYFDTERLKGIKTENLENMRDMTDVTGILRTRIEIEVARRMNASQKEQFTSLLRQIDTRPGPSGIWRPPQRYLTATTKASAAASPAPSVRGSPRAVSRVPSIAGSVPAASRRPSVAGSVRAASRAPSVAGSGPAASRAPSIRGPAPPAADIPRRRAMSEGWEDPISVLIERQVRRAEHFRHGSTGHTFDIPQ